MKKHTKKQSGQCPTGVQQEALERYQKLSYTDKTNRAIGKEYFRKKVVYVNSISTETTKNVLLLQVRMMRRRLTILAVLVLVVLVIRNVTCLKKKNPNLRRA